MSYFLKQSTAVTIKFGPFLDETDGKTAETGLTITQADVRLSKNGGDIAQKNESSALTHDELGFYDCDLDTTDTGTLGSLMVAVHESGALPVFQYFMVVPANVWDSLFGSDYLKTDVTQVEGSDATDQLYSAVATTQMTESYASDGSAPTIAQALFAIQQFLQERAVSGTTLTVKKLDGSTSAMTFTLDSASEPTSITRAS